MARVAIVGHFLLLVTRHAKPHADVVKGCLRRRGRGPDVPMASGALYARDRHMAPVRVKDVARHIVDSTPGDVLARCNVGRDLGLLVVAHLHLVEAREVFLELTMKGMGNFLEGLLKAESCRPAVFGVALRVPGRTLAAVALAAGAFVGSLNAGREIHTEVSAEQVVSTVRYMP